MKGAVPAVTTTSEQAFDSERDEEEGPRPWRAALTWSGLLTAGVIVYELTNQPAVGVATTCLKIGWEDFKTAYWLRRVDPRKARGRACWWAYVGLGLWKVAAASFVTTAAIALGAFALSLPIGNAAPNRVDQALMGAFYTLLPCIALATGSAFYVVWLAYRDGLKIWLHESVNQARRHGVWPPYDPARIWPPPQGDWEAPSRMGLLIMFPTVYIMLPTVLLKFVETLPVWLFFILGVANVVVAGLWFKTVRSVSALQPSECWPRDEVAAAADDPVN